MPPANDNSTLPEVDNISCFIGVNAKLLAAVRLKLSWMHWTKMLISMFTYQMSFVYTFYTLEHFFKTYCLFNAKISVSSSQTRLFSVLSMNM